MTVEIITILDHDFEVKERKVNNRIDIMAELVLYSPVTKQTYDCHEYNHKLSLPAKTYSTPYRRVYFYDDVDNLQIYGRI